MGREEPAKYESFRMLDLGEDTFREWDEELLEQQFRKLWSGPGHVWTYHGNIIGIIRRGHCDAGRYLDRLLDEMQRMEDLEPFEMTLIIENMAGRTESGKDGGAYLLRSHPGLQKKAEDVMQRLISARSADPGMDERAQRAISRYKMRS